MDFGERDSDQTIRFSFECLTELLTTPQLHYAVRCYNDNGAYGDYTEAGYFNKICTAFQKLIEVKMNSSSFTVRIFFQITPGAKCSGTLAIDAANGIGAQKLLLLRQRLSELLPIEIFNDGTKGRLNDKVKSTQTPVEMRICSVDEFSAVRITSKCIRKHPMVYR